jgi:hypothetical protein
MLDLTNKLQLSIYNVCVYICICIMILKYYCVSDSKCEHHTYHPIAMES